MKLVIGTNRNTFMPEIGRVVPGGMVQYQGHVYIKVDTKKTGQDVHIKHQTDHCVLLNPKYGSTRKIQEKTKVEVLGLCANGVEVYVVRDRNEMINHLRW